MRAVQALQRTARFTGFLSGWLAVLVGIIHILTIEAHLVWPTREEGATGWSVIEDDVNKYIWRLKLFSLEPDVFSECTLQPQRSRQLDPVGLRCLDHRCAFRR